MTLSAIREHLDRDLYSLIKNEKDETKWVDKIGGKGKDKDGTKLVRFQEAVYKTLKQLIHEKSNAHKSSTHEQLVKFATETADNLGSRKLDNETKKKFDETTKKVAELSSKIQPVHQNYQAETIGLPKKAVKKTKSKSKIHLYSENKTVKKIKKKWEKSSTEKTLPEYIAKEITQLPSAEKKQLQGNIVKYLTKEEAKEYSVTFKDGKVKQQGHTLKGGNYIYVLNMKMTKLFMGIKEKGAFHHSSFTAGLPVACAGMIKIARGKIESINLHSGHYKPTKENGANLIKFLSDESRLGDKAKAFAFA